ncbi:MAG: hypothetical protein JNM94_01630 [Phycisphaerae bacterium]|nr:hypothetical protein [Phycisphaerae bacterium]
MRDTITRHTHLAVFRLPLAYIAILAGVVALHVASIARAQARDGVDLASASSVRPSHESPSPQAALLGACEPTWAPTFGAFGGFLANPYHLTTYDAGLGDGPQVYVGGSFPFAGGTPATNIARWNGSTWEDVAGGTNAIVRAFLNVDGGPGVGPTLIVGGDFTEAGGVPAHRVAVWNGVSWSALGEGPGTDVNSLAMFDDGDGPTLYAGGNGVWRWDGATWTSIGLTTEVFSLVVHDDGTGPSLYAGGSFTTWNGTVYDGIARWTGTEWLPVGEGFQRSDGSPAYLYTLVVVDSGDGPRLYAGGAFELSASTPCRSIAVWDGASWSGVGGGVDVEGSIRQIVAMDDGNGPALFAAGGFASIGGVPASCVARWDGSTWSALGGGVDGDVFGGVAVAVAVEGAAESDLWLCGWFLSAGGLPARAIATWNGEVWSSLGQPLVSADTLAYFDDGSGSGPAVYAGGNVDASLTAESIVRGIGRWDGSSWGPLGAGLGEQGEAWATAAAIDALGPALYVGGLFSESTGGPARNIARWDGVAWSQLGEGTSSAVTALLDVHESAPLPSGLYVGGFFSTAGGVPASRIARWHDGTWSPLGMGIGAGPSTRVEALATLAHDGEEALYVGGYFQNAGTTGASNVARWNGTAWSGLGGGTNGVVSALCVYDDGSGPALYAGGAFTVAGDVPAERIARWDGTAWSPLGLGTDGPVRGLVVFDDGSGPALYVGGEFVTAGGIPVHGLARWNGATWSTVDAGLQAPGSVTALIAIAGDETTGGSLIVSGEFVTSTSGDSFIARYEGCPIGSPGPSADLDGDGAVSGTDLAILLGAWGTVGGPADLDEDGTVGASDLGILLALWHL